MAGVEKFVSSQPQYSMLWRGPERDVIPASREHGISQIVWSPLAQGVLTGKYKPGEPPPEGTRASSESMGGFMQRALDQRLLERVQELRPMADELGLSMAQLALAWVLREAERRLGDHRCEPARAGRGQRRGVGRRARPLDARADRRDPRRQRRLGAARLCSLEGLAEDVPG